MSMLRATPLGGRIGANRAGATTAVVFGAFGRHRRGFGALAESWYGDGMPLPREVFEKIVYYRREVDRIWNEYMRPGRSQSLAAVPAPVDIYETPDTINIDVELPGIAADSIEVSVSTDVMVIEGVREKPDLQALPGARFHLAERAYGRFQRIVEMPAAGNMGRMEARLDAGLLMITIPKVDDRRGRWRRVPVQVSTSAESRS